MFPNIVEVVVPILGKLNPNSIHFHVNCYQCYFNSVDIVFVIIKIRYKHTYEPKLSTKSFEKFFSWI